MSALRIGTRVVLWTAAIVSLLTVLALVHLAVSDDRPDGSIGFEVLIAGIIAAWLAGYGLVRGWKREALAVGAEHALPTWRRALAFGVYAVAWLLIIAISGLFVGALVYGLTHPWRLSYDDWEKPRVLSAVCLLSFVALIPLFLLDRLQKYSYRLHRTRWTSLPRRIVHRVSRMIGRDHLVLVILVTGCVMGFVLMAIQSLLSEAGLSHPLIGIGFTLLLGLSVAAMSLLAIARWRRTELILDEAGLHLVGFRGWSIPWDAIADARLRTMRHGQIGLLALSVDRPERFGIRIGHGLLSRMSRRLMRDSDLQVLLTLFLERPKHIVADVKAFMARAKSEGATPGAAPGERIMRTA